MANRDAEHTQVSPDTMCPQFCFFTSFLSITHVLVDTLRTSAYNVGSPTEFSSMTEDTPVDTPYYVILSAFTAIDRLFCVTLFWIMGGARQVGQHGDPETHACSCLRDASWVRGNALPSDPANHSFGWLRGAVRAQEYWPHLPCGVFCASTDPDNL